MNVAPKAYGYVEISYIFHWCNSSVASLYYVCVSIFNRTGGILMVISLPDSINFNCQYQNQRYIFDHVLSAVNIPWIFH